MFPTTGNRVATGDLNQFRTRWIEMTRSLHFLHRLGEAARPVLNLQLRGQITCGSHDPLPPSPPPLPHLSLPGNGRGECLYNFVTAACGSVCFGGGGGGGERERGEVLIPLRRPLISLSPETQKIQCRSLMRVPAQLPWQRSVTSNNNRKLIDSERTGDEPAQWVEVPSNIT